MPLTAKDLHKAFLQAQREIYHAPKTKQCKWTNLNGNEQAAYIRMAELLNEKLADQQESACEAGAPLDIDQKACS